MVETEIFSQSVDDRFGLPEPVVSRQGEGLSGIKYEIMGSLVQTLIIRLKPGELVYTESGGLGWMSSNIAMNTRLHEGGWGNRIKHAVFGKSPFLVEYTSKNGPGVVAFTANFPGKIVPIHLKLGQNIMVQRKRFLCAEKTISLDITFQKTLNPVLGGMDFAMQQLSGSGVVFVSLEGDSMVYTLAEDQTLRVDPELVAMYDPTVTFDIQMLDGYKNILFSGKKLYHTVLRGPGRVFLQTMAIQRLAKALSPHLPTQVERVVERERPSRQQQAE